MLYFLVLLLLCRDPANRILHMKPVQSCSSLSVCCCSPWLCLPQLSSTPLQVLLYLNSWYFAAFYLAEIFMFIYKGLWLSLEAQQRIMNTFTENMNRHLTDRGLQSAAVSFHLKKSCHLEVCQWMCLTLIHSDVSVCSSVAARLA